ncbi:MAG: hypothetical protein NUV53_04010 [Patescibacteria group bacterium]|nr:hypothetical protein [Patescibacteria group bacterium]
MAMYRMRKIWFPRTPIAVDFDGVIHAYRKGFLDGSVYDTPTPGVGSAMARLRKKYYVVVYSARTRSRVGCIAVTAYLKKHRIPFDEVVGYKPPAKFYIDDRAIRFKNWQQTLQELERFEKELGGRPQSAAAKESPMPRQ